MGNTGFPPLAAPPPSPSPPAIPSPCPPSPPSTNPPPDVGGGEVEVLDGGENIDREASEGAAKALWEWVWVRVCVFSMGTYRCRSTVLHPTRESEVQPKESKSRIVLSLLANLLDPRVSIHVEVAGPRIRAFTSGIDSDKVDIPFMATSVSSVSTAFPPWSFRITCTSGADLTVAGVLAADINIPTPHHLDLPAF